MQGLVLFAGGCGIVAGLSLLPPDSGRWVALAFVGLVATHVVRRIRATAEDVAKPKIGAGTSV